MKATLQLETLACPTCAKKIEAALKKSKGVQSVNILYNASKAKIEFDEQITNPQILSNVITTLGYDVLAIK